MDRATFNEIADRARTAADNMGSTEVQPQQARQLALAVEDLARELGKVAERTGFGRAITEVHPQIIG